MSRFYKLFGKLRTALCVISCLLVTTFLISSPDAARAADEELFTVRDVAVDVTADSAAAAREQAFAQAQQTAFAQLAERLLPEDGVATFQPPETAVISTLIKDFEITKEQLSNVRYLGTYTFRFDDSAVRDFLGAKNLSYTDVVSKPVLILPFYQTGTRTILWGESNLWLAAWNTNQTARGLVPLILPIGDAQDVADIDDDQALTYDPERLAAMINRYNAGGALIIIAATKEGQSAQTDSTEHQKLEVTLYRADEKTPQFLDFLTITAEDPAGSLFETAVTKSAKSIQKSWKNQTAASPSQTSSLKARVRFGSMPEWVSIQKKLRDLSGMDTFKLLSLTRNEAMLELQFQGDESRLRLALEQADLTLGTGQNSGGWGFGGSAPVYDIYKTASYQNTDMGTGRP